MYKSKAFFVLSSKEHTFSRIILIIVPFIIFLLIDDETHHLESIMLSLFVFVFMIAAVMSISPIILITIDGMYCVLWLKKTRFMAWKDVQVVGRTRQSVGTIIESSPMFFIYFASAPMNPKILGRNFYAPQLTDDFFFLTDSKRLQFELKNHLKESDYNRIYAASRDGSD